MDERINLMFYAIIALFVICSLLIINIILLKKKYNKFIKTTDKVNIESILIKNQEQIAELIEFKEYFEKYEKKINKKLKKNISRVAIKKYNAFDGMGGELSALICMLDEYGDGVLINIVHTGELNHVFSKKIKKEECENALSADEKALLASI